MPGLDLNTLVTIAIFVAGIVYARWERGGEKHTKSVQVDTELRQRVMTLEEKVREHGNDSKSIARLETLYQTMARDMHELRSWAMEMRLRASYPAAPPPRSPFDFKGAREWTLDDEQRA